MKIEGPGRTQGASPAKKKGSVSGSGASFEDFMPRETSSAAETSASRQIASVDSLLTVQAAEDPTEKSARRRMQERSQKILDGLDGIRMAMLGGTLTVGHMVDIADVVASHRERIQDPRLVEIMDEIDLRAQVELAKMRVSINRIRDSGQGKMSF